VDEVDLPTKKVAATVSAVRAIERNFIRPIPTSTVERVETIPPPIVVGLVGIDALLKQQCG
jgi:hypothetical protein